MLISAKNHSHHKVFQLIDIYFERIAVENLEPVAAIEGLNSKWKFLKTKGFRSLTIR